jgi:hypothetical protein
VKVTSFHDLYSIGGSVPTRPDEASGATWGGDAGMGSAHHDAGVADDHFAVAGDVAGGGVLN